MALCVNPQFTKINGPPVSDGWSGIASLLDSAGLKIESVNLIPNDHSDSVALELRGMGQQQGEHSPRTSFRIVMEPTAAAHCSSERNYSSIPPPSILPTALSRSPDSLESSAPSLWSFAQGSQEQLKQQSSFQGESTIDLSASGQQQRSSIFLPASQGSQRSSEAASFPAQGFPTRFLQRVSSAPWDVSEATTFSNEAPLPRKLLEATLSLKPETAGVEHKESLLSWGPRLGCALVSPRADKPGKLSPQQTDVEDKPRKLRWEKLQGTLRNQTGIRGASEVAGHGLGEVELHLPEEVQPLGKGEVAADAERPRLSPSEGELLEPASAEWEGSTVTLTERMGPSRWTRAANMQQVDGMVLRRPGASPHRKPQLTRCLAMKPVRTDSPKAVQDIEHGGKDGLASSQIEDPSALFLPFCEEWSHGTARGNVPRCRTSPGSLQRPLAPKLLSRDSARPDEEKGRAGAAQSKTTGQRGPISPRKELYRCLDLNLVIRHLDFTTPPALQGLSCCTAAAESDTSSSKPGSMVSADWQEEAGNLPSDSEDNEEAAHTVLHEGSVPVQTFLDGGDDPQGRKAPGPRGSSLPISVEDMRRKSKVVKSRVRFLQVSEAPVASSDPALMGSPLAGDGEHEGFSPRGRPSFQGLLRHRLFSPRLGQARSFQDRECVPGDTEMWSMDSRSFSTSRAGSLSMERSSSCASSTPPRSGLLLERDGSCSSREEIPAPDAPLHLDPHPPRPLSIFARRLRVGQEVQETKAQPKEQVGKLLGFPRDVSWGSVDPSLEDGSSRGAEEETQNGTLGNSTPSEMDSSARGSLQGSDGSWGSLEEVDEGVLWEKLEERVVPQDKGIGARRRLQRTTIEVPRPSSAGGRVSITRVNTSSAASVRNRPCVSPSASVPMCNETSELGVHIEGLKRSPSPLRRGMELPGVPISPAAGLQPCRSPRPVQVTFPWGEVKSPRPVV